MGRKKNEVVVLTDKEAIKAKENEIKILIRSFYDLQKLRIQTGNRVVSSLKIQLGIQPSEKEKSDKEIENFLANLKKDYTTISEAVANEKISIKKFIDKRLEEEAKAELAAANQEPVADRKKTKKKSVKEKKQILLIRNEEAYRLVEIYMNLRDQEKELEKVISKTIIDHPLMEYFNSEECKGVGTLMAACMIAFFDIEGRRYESQFISYAGLNPVWVEKDGERKQIGRNKTVTYEVEYINKEGKKEKKKSIGYNPELHTILLGRLGPSFLKQKGSFYETIYREYRNRLENDPVKKEFSDLHKHNIANRYMIVCFVKNLFAEWKHVLGEDVPEQYHVSKLRRLPHMNASATKYTVNQDIIKEK